MTATKMQPSTMSRRVARVITELTGPAVSVVVALVVVAVHDMKHSGAAAAWGGVAALLCAGVPMFVIVKGARSGRWSDHHVPERAERVLPLGIGVVAVAVAIALLIVVRAPRDLIALVVAMLVGLLAVLVITHWWKVSIHAAVAAGVLGILLVLYGPVALIALAAVVGIAWSRTVLGAHSWWQVSVGACVGLVAAITVFPILQ